MLAWFALIWMLVPAAAAQGFDQSLDGLVRQRVITSQERKLLRGGGAAVPMERSRFEEACRTLFYARYVNFSFLTFVAVLLFYCCCKNK